VVRVAVDFDLALEKSTSFYDAELQLTFSAEFFNIFNHTEFPEPDHWPGHVVSPKVGREFSRRTTIRM
jgi:hypothetical protein